MTRQENFGDNGMSSASSSPRKLAKKQMNPSATPMRGAAPKRGPRPASNSSNGTAPGSPNSNQIVYNKSAIFAQSEEDDTVKVIVRVRPMGERELASCSGSSGAASTKPCVSLRDTKTVVLDDPSRVGGEYAAQYDCAMGPETSQVDMFATVGQSVVEHCMSGFNSSIFAYGQTGAGKTHTMVGEASRDADGGLSTSCGLVPRVFEALFAAISQMEQDHPLQSLRYSIKCSFLEIYNEEITDLLAPGSSGLQIRDGDLKKGLYVQGLSETEVVNADDVLSLINKGSASRHMAATKMNERSSRSHSVFTATIEAHERTETGLTNIRYAKLNLIDLAGSERTGRSGVTGERMAEAKSINRSLTVLGRVITALVERQKKPFTHVPYRDSRLTFLLQESLGGNSKTCIVANVSPAQDSAAETYSTLIFAANAKAIKNRAVVNEDVMGDMKALQSENSRLQRVLSDLQSQLREGTAAEVEALRQQLEQTQALFDQNNALINELRAEQNMLRKELSEVKAVNGRLSEEAVALKCDNSNLSAENDQLREDQACLREELEDELQRWKTKVKEIQDTATAEVARVSQELTELSSSHTTVTAHLEESRRVQKEAREEAAAAAARSADLQRETETLRARLAEAEADAKALQAKVASESNNVVKYKRMVGEITRLIDWASAASPGGLSLAATSSMKKGGRPQSSPAGSIGGGGGGSSLLIPAFRDTMLASAGKTTTSLASGSKTIGASPLSANATSPKKQPLMPVATVPLAVEGTVQTKILPAVDNDGENSGESDDVVAVEEESVRVASPAKKGVTTRRSRRRG